MKFARRRPSPGASAGDSDGDSAGAGTSAGAGAHRDRGAGDPVVGGEPGHPAASEPGARAPDGAPVAVLAAVLDGRRLWLATAARAGRLALRDQAGTVLDLLDLDPHDQPAHLSACLDLDGLPDDASRPGETEEPTTTAYDVVWVPGHRQEPVPVWGPPSPRPAGPARRHSVARRRNGFLQLRRDPTTSQMWLRSVALAGDAIELELAGAHTVEAVALRTADPGSTVLARYPVVAGRARITAAPLIGAGPQLLRVVAETAHEVTGRVGPQPDPPGLSLHREANDLADPSRGVLLPDLAADHRAETGTGSTGGSTVTAGGEPLLRLRWSPRGELEARILAKEQPGPDPADPDTGAETRDDTDTAAGADR